MASHDLKQIETAFSRLQVSLELCKSEVTAAVKSIPLVPAGQQQDEIEKLKKQVEKAKEDYINDLRHKEKEIHDLKAENAELKKKGSVTLTQTGSDIIITNLQKQVDELKKINENLVASHTKEVDALKKEIEASKAHATTSTPRKSEETLALAKSVVTTETKAGQTAYEFSSVSATGKTGPSQILLNLAYVKTNLNGKVTSKNGIQVWKVPKTATYRIKAFGSAGGQIHDKGKLAGCGAVIQGDFDLKQDQEVHILCGQEPSTTPQSIGGGGGGTFVVLADGTPLVVAGGGAGASTKHELKECMHATTATKGETTNGGTEGRGGWAVFEKTGGAGGGLKSDGTDGGGKGGKGFVNGGNGGEEDQKAPGRSCSAGGFGGGGGGEFSETGSSGGGGGYSGGGAGGEDCGPSGGGGSFNGGKNQVNVGGSEAYRGPGKVSFISL